MLTWRAVQAASWHVARGITTRMRRSAEATWQGRGWPTRGAGGAQDADTWQEATRVHGSTRTPVWGATWQVRVGKWRAHGLVGPGKKLGAVTQMHYRAPPYLTAPFPLFYSVWDYVPTESLFGKWRGRIARVRFKQEPSIAWTRVHAIIHQSTCWKRRLSGLDRGLTWWHVEPPEASDRHRDSIMLQWAWLHQTVAIFRDSGIGEHRQGAPRGTSWSVGSPSDGRRKWIKEIVGHDSHDLARSDNCKSTSLWLTVETCGSFQSVGSSSNGGRPWRSLIARSDRPPYLIRSDGSDQLCLTIVVHDHGLIVAWSRFDRGPIVTRSWLDRPVIGADLPWNWGHDHHQVINPPPRPIVAIDSLPQTDQTAWNFGPKFLFKKRCILPLKLNFWSIREGIKQISRKISSSSWSPRV